jgi:hypothetical protein
MYKMYRGSAIMIRLSYKEFAELMIDRWGVRPLTSLSWRRKNRGILLKYQLLLIKHFGQPVVEIIGWDAPDTVAIISKPSLSQRAARYISSGPDTLQ